MLDQRVAVGRERQAAANPLEQGDAEFLLQRGDLPTECGLRLIERPRRGGQRAFLGGHQEGSGSVPVEFDGAPVHAKLHRAATFSVNSPLLHAEIHSRPKRVV